MHPFFDIVFILFRRRHLIFIIPLARLCLMCYTRRMRTQTYTSEKATLQLMSIVTNGVKHNARLAEIATALRTVIDSYGALNRRERARLFNNAYNYARRLKASGDEWTRILASRTAYDSFMSVSRRVLASSDSRNKRIALGKAMTQFEHDYGYEPVFYACSYHSNCSCGHDDYQGKIYVDIALLIEFVRHTFNHCWRCNFISSALYNQAGSRTRS